RVPCRARLFPYTTLFRSAVLRRHFLRLLQAAELRRAELFQLLPAAVPHELQARVRRSAGEALADLLQDRAGNGHEAGHQDLLPRSEEHTSELQSRENLVC